MKKVVLALGINIGVLCIHAGGLFYAHHAGIATGEINKLIPITASSAVSNLIVLNLALAQLLKGKKAIWSLSSQGEKWNITLHAYVINRSSLELNIVDLGVRMFTSAWIDGPKKRKVRPFSGTDVRASLRPIEDPEKGIAYSIRLARQRRLKAIILYRYIGLGSQEKAVFF